MNSPSKLICLMGPTASGKTALALALARHHPIEIVSVDSALVYQGMDIGSGKPSCEELASVPHHLINVCDPSLSYSVGQFREQALQVIRDILLRQRIPLLVGGTMMYFKALLEGLAILPGRDSAIRETLDEEAKMIGWPALHQRLMAIDPQTALRVKPNDAQRIQRALEVYLLSKKTLSQWITEADNQPSTYQFEAIGFIPTLLQRQALHHRIEQRFLKMLEAGFLEEVTHLFERSDLNLNMPSIRCVGYRQAWEYLEGKYDKDTMIEKAIAATRQLAKRQITWLRSWPELRPMDFFEPTQALHHCDALLKQYGQSR